ncbi:MAG: hypothetical protein IKW62_01250 [Clostridia bacterium]|nr:hypothetical protein [Clostridia bacterium]
MKTYIAPEVEICMFDAEDVVTTSALTSVLEAVGFNAGTMNYGDLDTDLSDEVNILE